MVKIISFGPRLASTLVKRVVSSNKKRSVMLCGTVALLSLAVISLYAADEAQPPVVDPGTPGAAPSDAIVLFDGKTMMKVALRGRSLPSANKGSSI
ncbi:MAG: hypothetical protein NTW21_02770 [Verrucomicrobia bacterium]|nr:hypothetical protein [Verrucomicrobiota bacterium]